MIKIVWSPLAAERMEEIADYIAFDNPKAALKWIDSVFKKVDMLLDNPELGRVVPETGNPSIREILFGNYRIVYRLSDKSVQILTIRNFKQILPLDDIR